MALPHRFGAFDSNFVPGMNFPASTPRGQRALLTFSIEGLAAREAVLLKSLVRLLDHRTHQHWSWKEELADLRVVGDQFQAVDEDPARAVPVLNVGHIDPQRGHFLALPLHTDALESVLNRLGAMVVHARGLGIAAPEENLTEGDEFRLSQWPPAALLETPARMKMATLLTGRPASLAALQHRSAATPKDCADFLSALKEAGLIETVVSGMAPQAGPASDTQTAAPLVSALARPPVQPGLLARIRNRLGLLPTGSK